MTSRERVMASMNYREPDRVPVDFGGHRSSGIAVQAYKKLREYLGLKPSELYVYDVVQQLAVVEDDVLDLFGADVVMLGYEFYRKPEYWKEWRMHDGTEVKIPKAVDIRKNNEGDYIIFSPKGEPGSIQKKSCLYFEQTLFPYYGSDDREFLNVADELMEIMWWHVECPPGPNSIGEKGRLAKELRANTDRAIYGIFGGGLIEPGEMGFRMDNFLMEMALDPERIATFLDKLLDYHMVNLEKYLKVVGPHIDIIGFSDDLGMQSGPQISPQMYDELFKPRYQRMWSLVKEKAPHIRICLHCCGSIYALLPSLIDAGLDSFNPVQTTCFNMEPERLKGKFKDRITFWGGGCDTRWVLSHGSTEDVEQNVRENIEKFREGGGFIFQQVHNILADVPPENIVAMFEAAKKYGQY